MDEISMMSSHQGESYHHITQPSLFTSTCLKTMLDSLSADVSKDRGSTNKGSTSMEPDDQVP